MRVKWISHRVENFKLMWNLASHCKICVDAMGSASLLRKGSITKKLSK